MNKSSKNRLTEKEIFLFPSDSLFDKLGRTVCQAGCLPRKELFEAWEVAKRVRRRFRGGRVVDFACGHGLLAWILLLLDDSSPEAIAIDRTLPPSAGKLADVILNQWPRLQDRVRLLEGDLETVALNSDDLIVSVHACGDLTDLVLDRAITARARVAVLPCCHDLDTADQGNLTGWLDGPLAADVVRAQRLAAKSYHIVTQQVPVDITPQNRLLLGNPIR